MIAPLGLLVLLRVTQSTIVASFYNVLQQIEKSRLAGSHIRRSFLSLRSARWTKFQRFLFGDRLPSLTCL